MEGLDVMHSDHNREYSRRRARLQRVFVRSRVSPRAACDQYGRDFMRRGRRVQIPSRTTRRFLMIRSKLLFIALDLTLVER